MKYFSEEAISWAIGELKATTHPFLGITFLACKERTLPVGKTTPVRLDSWRSEHLLHHHRLDPNSEFFFQPFRGAKNWVRRDYASTGLQAVNTQTFEKVLLHTRGKPEWGFANDYVGQANARIQELRYGRVPLAAIAIWMSKGEQWQEWTTLSDLIAEFVRQYNITAKERRELFSEQDTVDSDFPLFRPNKPDQKAVAYSVEPPPDAREPEGTLSAIRMERVGPADELRLDLGERLTVLTGDNGLGKTFLLDVAWWAATEGWAGRPATPFRTKDLHESLIEYELRSDAGVKKCVSHFDAPTQSWIRQTEYPQVPSLYVYARQDGAFSVADDRLVRVGEATIDFTARQVWDGKRNKTGGLIRDWVTWQTTGAEGFPLLMEVLRCLSPSDLGLLEPGRPKRLPDDWRPMPVIRHSYGEVPILDTSAGVRRILAIAYVVVWSWQEHLWESERLGLEPVRRVVLLVDDIEAHLHPFWQRTILPAILKVGELLHGDVEMQIVVSTHSPLVLASLETKFRSSTDSLYHLSLRDSKVVLESKRFVKYGDVSSWLTSPVLGLRHARSKEAERAIERAKRIQLTRKPEKSAVEEVSRELMEVLPADDPFWHRWTYLAERVGVEL